MADDEALGDECTDEGCTRTHYEAHDRFWHERTFGTAPDLTDRQRRDLAEAEAVTSYAASKPEPSPEPEPTVEERLAALEDVVLHLSRRLASVEGRWPGR